MKHMTVLEYLKATGMLDRIEKETSWCIIPLTINGLEELIDDAEFGYWSRPVDDVDLDSNFYSVEDIAIVTDVYGISRCFDLTPTETW